MFKLFKIEIVELVKELKIHNLNWRERKFAD